MPYNTNFTWVEKELLKKCQSSYVMVARPKKYNFAIPASANNNVRMFFEPLSDEPAPILDSDNIDFARASYIAFDTNLDADFLPDFYDLDSYDMDARVEECEDFYRNKLVVFTPIYKITSDGLSFKNMSFINVVKDNGGALFIPVPKVDLDNRRFERILKEKEYFVLDEFDNKLVEGTNIVICGEYIYRFRSRQPFQSFLVGSDLRNEAWKFNDVDEIVKVKMSDVDDFDGYAIDVDRNIYMLEDSLIQSILDTDKYVSIDEPENKNAVAEEIEVNVSSEEVDIPSEEEMEEISEEEENKVSNASEITFINGLAALTKSYSLVYEYKDLVNFHTSVKTNPLTILSGMSGTGKTQLAYNYARMLDLSEDNNTLLFMPISPAYSEPSDVLGYLNPMTNEYVPSETGLVDFLIHANDNKNKMHMVIFDEMNLSQVEYWFSPFISILEKDMGERFLKLYDSGSEPNNKDKYKSKIKIDDNVIFVGTVNIDETTKDFSDRLLDRTFVINLKKIDFKSVYQSLNTKDEEKFDPASKCNDASVFMSWNKKYNKKSLDAFVGHEEELDFLDEFSKLLSESISSDGISHRVMRNIGYFLLNVPEGEEGAVIERAEALDIIINQTVMQKIRGTEAQLSSLIGVAGDDQRSPEKSSLIALLDKYQNISSFENVRKAIYKKAEDLRVNGYTN